MLCRRFYLSRMSLFTGFLQSSSGDRTPQRRDLSKEVVSLVSVYLAGQTGTMEFATTMEKIRLQRSVQQTPAIET